MSRPLALLVLLLPLLITACLGRVRKNAFSYSLDPSLPRSQVSMGGLDGGPARDIGAALGPDGHRVEFIEEEVVFHPRDQGDLRAFLARYHGKVLRDGVPRPIPGLPKPKVLSGSGWVLVRVDPALAPLDHFAADMASLGARGEHKFSSPEAAGIVALSARERAQGRSVGPNYVMYPNEVVLEKHVFEHMDGKGGFLDAAGFPWMTDDTTPPGLGIGVVRAWDYLRYKNVPPPQGNWHPPLVAIVDNGFALDDKGLPLAGNLDYEMGKRPLQFNLSNPQNPSAGGPNTDPCSGCTTPPAHGQEVFGMAAAFPRNKFGGAGTGGDVVRPLILKANSTNAEIGEAIRAAALHGAAVINVSTAFSCLGQICGFLYDAIAQLQDNVTFATALGSIVVASAGNSGENDVNRLDNPICTLDNVICVGEIGPDKMARNSQFNTSGFGPRVAIWAPDFGLTTVVPKGPPYFGSFDPQNPAGPSDVANPGGTSIAAPFLAGIVGLLKALEPGLTTPQAAEILRATARASPDPKVKPGYVDAFAAVERLSPNQPPTAQITFPMNGASVYWNKPVDFTGSVADPEQGGGIAGVSVSWNSNLQGFLCSGVTCHSVPLVKGQHTISLTANDPFGARSTAKISLAAINKPPQVSIGFPSNGNVFATSQKINFRGAALSLSEGQLDPKNFAWSSSLTGALAAGAGKDNFWTSLAPGIHVVTLDVGDSSGDHGQALVQIIVQAANDVPTAEILQPQTTEFDSGAAIQFQGAGIEPNGKSVPDQNLVWKDNGVQFATGAFPAKRVLGGVNCAVTPHVITLEVTGASGKNATHVITIFIGKIC